MLGITLTTLDVFKVNSHVVIPVDSTLFVEETECMKDFVSGNSQSFTAFTDGNVLLPVPGVASDLGVTPATRIAKNQ